MKTIKLITVGLLFFISVLGVLLSLIAIADPVGTKMADDNEPFGPPPSRMGSASMMVVFLAIGALGICWGCHTLGSKPKSH